MEYEIGTIEKIENGVAKIYFDNKGACKGCGMCQSTPDGFHYIELPVSADYVVGQEVRIGINSNARTVAAVLIFLAPMLVFIAALALSYWLLGIPETDDRGVLYSLAIGGGCLVAYFVGLWLAAKKSKTLLNLKPFVIV